jgi:hypothetical protein
MSHKSHFVYILPLHSPPAKSIIWQDLLSLASALHASRCHSMSKSMAASERVAFMTKEQLDFVYLQHQTPVVTVYKHIDVTNTHNAHLS